MSRLDLAAERLAKALDALESAAAPLANVRDSAGETARKAGQLSAEREKLLARVAELEEEVHSLAGVGEEIEDRLDGAISEIRTALGR